MVAKKSAKDVSNDIKDVAKELAMLDLDPTADVSEPEKPIKKAKEVAKKAATTAKKATETAKKATAKATETAKKATAKATETAKKVASTTTKAEVSKTAVVEYAGNQYFVEDVIARCEAKFKETHKKKSYKDIKVYIKPENNAAYYVVDDKSADKIDLL